MIRQYHFQIAGLRLLLESPVDLSLHPHLIPFLCEKGEGIDAVYRVVTVPPAELAGARTLYSDGRMSVMEQGSLQARCYTVWDRSPGSSQNPILFSQDENYYSLYVPQQRLDFFARESDFTGLLALEQLFARHHRFFLHSSGVLYDGKAVLFSGPSGIGKSTHAELWEAHLGAEVLNGDRCVIEKTPDGFVAHGSPCCGSSGICKQRFAPVKGIYLLQQAGENSVSSLQPGISFRLLLEQCVLNLWDPAQTVQVTDLLQMLLSEVPIWQLSCRPDEQAVMLAKNTIF